MLLRSTRQRGARSQAIGGPAPRRTRRVELVSSLAVAALMLTACGSGGSSGGSSQGGGSEGPVTITFANWADSETATRPGIEDMIKKFEAAHPGITVKSQPISFSDIGHTLVQQVQAGNAPDVAELSGNDTFALAATGKLQDLSSMLGSSKSLFLDSELKACTSDGKLIAMPWTVNPPGLWYNKKLMQDAGLDPTKPPKTTDDLMSDLQAIHAKDPSVLGIGLDTTNRSFSLTSNWSWMKTFNAQPFKGDTATADTDGMKASLTFMRNLAQQGYLSTGKKIGEFRPLAAQNKVAFVWDQPVLQGVAQAASKQTDQQFYDTWGVAPLPAGPSGKSYSVELGHQLVMFKDSKHQQADLEFMKWLATSDEAVTGYTIKYESSLPPLANPSADVQKLTNTPVLQAFSKDVLPTVISPEYGPNYSAAYSPIMSGVQNAVTSSQPIDSITKTMQSGLQQAFK